MARARNDRSTGRVDAFQSQTAVAVAFLFASFTVSVSEVALP